VQPKRNRSAPIQAAGEAADRLQRAAAQRPGVARSSPLHLQRGQPLIESARQRARRIVTPVENHDMEGRS